MSFLKYWVVLALLGPKRWAPRPRISAVTCGFVTGHVVAPGSRPLGSSAYAEWGVNGWILRGLYKTHSCTSSPMQILATPHHWPWKISPHSDCSNQISLRIERRTIDLHFHQTKSWSRTFATPNLLLLELFGTIQFRLLRHGPMVSPRIHEFVECRFLGFF